MKLGDKEFYSFEEAAQVLHPLYTVSMLKSKAYRNQIPHHGGHGHGKVCFSDGDLKQIIKMSAKPVAVEKPRTVEQALSPVPELPAAFRQTSRSRARHKGAA